MSLRAEREAVLGRVTSAFARQDHSAVLGEMRSDVEVVVPGSTEFAGTYRGGDEVYRWLLAMRRVFVPAGESTEFSHAGNDMVIRQLAFVRGRGWVNCFRFTFDELLIERISWEPDDMKAFDALIKRMIDVLEEPKPSGSGRHTRF